MYTSLRSGNKSGLDLFLNFGMLEWLKSSLNYIEAQKTDTAKNSVTFSTQAQYFNANKNELVVLMTNMMEVGDYGV